MSAQPPFPPSSRGGYNEFGDAPTLPTRIPGPPPDPYAVTQISQPPAFPIPEGPSRPPIPEATTPQPGLGLSPWPGTPGQGRVPPRKRRIGLLVLLGVVLLVVLVGAGVGFFVLRPGSTASPPPCTLSGYTAFTSPDHTFCVAYPTGWQVVSAAEGSGAQFSGPAHQLFTVSNLGAFSGTAAGFDRAVCVRLGGIAGSTAPLTLADQTWTQLHCSLDAGNYRAIVEAVVSHGKLYHMDYGSATLAFPSNRSQFFTPMEQSFRFL